MSDSAPLPENYTNTAFAAFRFRDFRLLTLSALFSIIALQMQSVAIGWQLYELTGRPLDLGYVGLALFLPALAFSPFTGHAADRFDRRLLMVSCHTLLSLSSLLFLILTQLPKPSLLGLYAVLVLIGTTRAFLAPTSQAFTPNVVPLEVLPNAIAWNSSIWQFSTVAGPAVGGVLYAARGAAGVYLSCAVLELSAIAFLLAIRTRNAGSARRSDDPHALSAGLRFVWNRPVILGAISLDLFAVLLGGTFALLPIFARDVLHIGPRGLGVLRSAPAIGSLIIAVGLAYRPIVQRAGAIMFACVAVFGLATIAFGLSRSFILSVVTLAVAGAVDMISVYIRHNLVQLQTPDGMRGRVAAVNMIFIGASNELGEFESGVLAQWVGAVPAVVLGGIGTLVVVAVWIWLFPALWSVDRVDQVTSNESTDTPEPAETSAQPSL